VPISGSHFAPRREQRQLTTSSPLLPLIPAFPPMLLFRTRPKLTGREEKSQKVKRSDARDALTFAKRLARRRVVRFARSTVSAIGEGQENRVAFDDPRDGRPHFKDDSRSCAGGLGTPTALAEISRSPPSCPTTVGKGEGNAPF
jgi:hypothetical protein